MLHLNKKKKEMSVCEVLGCRHPKSRSKDNTKLTKFCIKHLEEHRKACSASAAKKKKEHATLQQKFDLLKKRYIESQKREEALRKRIKQLEK